MIPLLAAALEVMAWLERGRWPACVIGGLAVQRWGEPRLTRDVDVTVLTGAGREQEFVSSALAAFEPRRADAGPFALATRVLLVRSAAGIDLDIALGGIPFEEELMARASVHEFAPDCRLSTCSAEDLVVLKAVAGRARDLADLETIVARQFGRIDVGRVRRWLACFAEVIEDRDPVSAFETCLAAAARRSRRVP
ncbi:MAG: nucleotidyl transferase AbiEii/AbiGii toxin family protein [Vicinamibacterales bacterium]|nr:nucleotidyl transferase AbiEii/AbiGii toxin family protein [Vicinamibacterales bacterium]